MKDVSCKRIVGLAVVFGFLWQAAFSLSPCSNTTRLDDIISGVGFRVASPPIAIEKGRSASVEVLLENKTKEEKTIPFVGFQLLDFKMTDETGAQVPSIYEQLSVRQSKGDLTKDEMEKWISYHWFSGQRFVELAQLEELKLSFKLDRKFEFNTTGRFCLEIYRPGSANADVVIAPRTLGRLSIDVK